MNSKFQILTRCAVATLLLPFIAGFTKCAGPEGDMGWLTIQLADASKEQEAAFVMISAAESDQFYCGGDTKNGVVDFGPMKPGEYRIVGNFESAKAAGDKPVHHTLFASVNATIVKHERTTLTVKPTGPVGVASLEVSCGASLATPGKDTQVTVLISELPLDMSAARLSAKTAFDSHLLAFALIKPGQRAVFDGMPKGHYYVEAVGGLDQGEEPKSLAHTEVDVTAKDMNSVTFGAAK